MTCDIHCTGCQTLIQIILAVIFLLAACFMIIVGLCSGVIGINRRNKEKERTHLAEDFIIPEETYHNPDATYGLFTANNKIDSTESNNERVMPEGNSDLSIKQASCKELGKETKNKVHENDVLLNNASQEKKTSPEADKENTLPADTK